MAGCGSDRSAPTPCCSTAPNPSTGGTPPDTTDVAARVEAWRGELWRRRDRGELAALEIVPAATTVLLDGVPEPAATAALVAGWTPEPLTTTAAAGSVTSP